MENFRITNNNHKNLDGIRALGILMVMVSHFFGEYVNVQVFWTSIDLLFALSGLLISGILIETVEDPRYFKKFYMRRILRIFPLYYFLILLFSIYAYFITIHPDLLAYFRNNIVYYLTYTQNWYFIHAGMPFSGPLNHTWSLAIDEQIYLCWPFLIWVFRKPQQLINLCIVTIMFSLVFRLCYNHYLISHPSPHEYPYFHNTFCRLDSFASGSLLYCLLRFNRYKISDKTVLVILLITLLLFLACGVADNSFSKTGFYMRNFGCTLAGLHFSTWLYFALHNGHKFIGYLFSNKIMIYIGKISYSLYVFHLFILIMLAFRINNFMSLRWGIKSLFIPLVICFILSFIISILSYEYFEKPIIKLKRRFSYKTK